MRPKNQVYWYTLRQSPGQPLTEDVKTDVAVVGGGMAGLMCAQKVAAHGLSVIVVEAGFCGAGASGKSSGFITPDSELELNDLVAEYGPERAQELWEFVTSGCEAIRQNILELKLGCDYQVQDSLFIANTKGGWKKVTEEHAARQKLKYESILYSKRRLPEVIGSTNYHGGVRYPGTFGIISYLYCQGLKEVLKKQGVRIYENTPVQQLDTKTINTVNGHAITAEHIVFCADHFLPSLGLVPKDVYHAQTFLALSPPLPLEDQKKVFPDQPLLVWDTNLIYQYFRFTGEGRLLLGGSSLVYTYLPKEVYAPQFIIHKLSQYLRDKFPNLKVDLEYLWSGLIGVSKDFLPVAGAHHELSDVYYIGGAAGLPWAAALGRYVADKIAKRSSTPFDQYFKTPRKYPIPYTVQNVLGKPITFALSHGVVKYLK